MLELEAEVLLESIIVVRSLGKNLCWIVAVDRWNLLGRICSWIAVVAKDKN
jgi:hypothetical protein